MSHKVIRPLRPCEYCATPFASKENAVARRAKARFCSAACWRRSRIRSRVVILDSAVANLILPCGTVGLISTVDAPLVAGLACHLDKDGYVRAAHQGLHRLLIGATGATDVDHRNGIRHDNRRENLRLATEVINSRNRHHVRATSGVKGVSRLARCGVTRFRAFIHVDGRKVVLGLFGSLEEATAARAAGEAELWGDAR